MRAILTLLVLSMVALLLGCPEPLEVEQLPVQTCEKPLFEDE